MTGFIARYPNWTRLFGFLIMAMCLLLVINRFGSDLSALLSSKWKLNVFWLCVSFVLMTAAMLFGGLTWVTSVRAARISQSWQYSLRVHFISNVTKYLPGYAWQVFSKGFLMRRGAILHQQIGIVIILELAALVFSGSLLVLWISDLERAGLLTLGSVIILWLVRRRLVFDVKWWSLSLMIAATGWLLYGVAFWMLSMAFGSLSLSTLPSYIAVFIGSIIIGLLAVGVPAGIGVREVVILALLSSTTDVIPWSVVVISLRVMLVIIESVAAYMAFRL